MPILRSLSLLLLLVSLTAGAQDYSKMSSFVRRAASRHSSHISASSVQQSFGSHAQRVAVSPHSGVPRMTVLVRSTSAEALTDNDARILASFDNDIYVATIPLNRLSDVSLQPSVKRIEANAPCSVTNDTTRHILHTDEARELLRSQSSKYPSDVVIGVMDIGFDFTHPTFYSSDGQRYRIKRVWDMLEMPRIDTTLFVGREYLTEHDILAKQHTKDAFFVTHGTHTAGTAAGSGFDGQQCTDFSHGMESDIVLVGNSTSNNSSIIPDSLQNLYTSATDVLGFKYIFDYADSVGKPCVINFSEGSRPDFYENTLYYETMQQMCSPGHIIVASAGNEGMKLTYMRRANGMDKASSLYRNSSANYGGIIFCSDQRAVIDVTFKATTPKAVTITLNSDKWDMNTSYNDTIYIGDDPYAITYAKYPNMFDTLHVAGEFFIYDLAHKKFGYDDNKVMLTVHGNEELFFYNGEFYAEPDYPSDADGTHNISIPSCIDGIICVGATGHRPGFINYTGEWTNPLTVVPAERGAYSSVGPALSGLTKPDIMAPGTNIISAVSSFFLDEYDSSWTTQLFTHNDRTYGWYADSGTSMAAPAVTAIIAMWLTACPTLTYDQIFETFAHTASKRGIMSDPATSSLPTDAKNSVYGWGEIDALAGLTYIIDNFVADGIIEVAATPEGNSHYDSPRHISDLSGRRYPSLNVLGDGLYIIDGRIVHVKR